MNIVDESPEHWFPTIIEVPIVPTPTSPYTLPGYPAGGQFHGVAEIDLTGLEWTRLYLILTNRLHAASEDLGGPPGSGTVASIEKNILYGPVALTIIPEPACLSLLALGVLAALRRKRR